MLVSRSTEESHLYMHLHPCQCGQADFEWRQQGMAQREGQLVVSYTGECERCQRPRTFEFALVPEPSPPPPALGGRAPSHIIDPGEFLQTSQVLAATAPVDPSVLSDDDFHRAQDALAFAIASLDEVLKFIPPGAGAVPPAAFRSHTSRELYRECPERFSHARLAATRERYERRLAAYQAAISNGGAPTLSAPEGSEPDDTGYRPD